jgi:hypothetical protein
MPETRHIFEPPAAARPTKLSVELRGVLDAALRFVSTDQPIPESVLGRKARAGLEARKLELRETMRPCEPAQIGQTLMTFVDMRGGFKPGSAAEANSFNRHRAADLCEIPLWALVETVRAYRRGEIGAGVTRPTAGQLRKHAEERAAALFVEMRDIERVLAAKVVSEPTEEDMARRAEIGRRLRELGAQLASTGSNGRLRPTPPRGA